MNMGFKEVTFGHFESNVGCPYLVIKYLFDVVKVISFCFGIYYDVILVRKTKI